jgi:hypothetical protein
MEAIEPQRIGDYGRELMPETATSLEGAGEMLERVAIDAILDSLFPAFIGDFDILYWPVEHRA